MSKELHHLVPCDAYVVMPDAPVATRRAQDMSVPAESCDLRLVPTYQMQLLPSFDAPQLDVARTDTDTEERAVVRKVDREDVGAPGRLADLHDRTCLSLPDVCVLREHDHDDILHGPQEQVEVKVVNHPGRVKHPLWLRGDLSRLVGNRA